MSDEEDVLKRATERLGTVVHGKYRLDAVLGVGGMAIVYAATHRNQKRFALKLLRPEFSVRSEFRARFLREGYVANSVAHGGVVEVLDDDVDETGAAFLVMELLEGADLESRRVKAGGRLPLQLTLDIAQQVLIVLSAAHDKAVVHRDIKPANLFLLETGEVKVLDFGVARLREASSQIQATRSGAVLGSPAFMAPEQAAAHGNEIDARTDLWALGATLFTLLSGRFVHDAENGQQTLIRAATEPARSLADVAPEVPAPVVELVAKALMFERAARFESAEEMRQAVAAAQRELFGEPPAPVRVPTRSARAARNRALLVGLGAVLCGGLVFARGAASSSHRDLPVAPLTAVAHPEPDVTSARAFEVPLPAPLGADAPSSPQPHASASTPAPRARLAKLALVSTRAAPAPAPPATATVAANPLQLDLQ